MGDVYPFPSTSAGVMRRLQQWALAVTQPLRRAGFPVPPAMNPLQAATMLPRRRDHSCLAESVVSFSHG